MIDELLANVLRELALAAAEATAGIISRQAPHILGLTGGHKGHSNEREDCAGKQKSPGQQ
ncbi:hypothetical protein [Amycolatopsis sp. NPDC059657]|uniref:hypothetical protein n=1 Tax=Amycolatopsis sp. NPDC059657 TaxID=3346899 RepID=UPI00366E1788